MESTAHRIDAAPGVAKRGRAAALDRTSGIGRVLAFARACWHGRAGRRNEVRLPEALGASDRELARLGDRRIEGAPTALPPLGLLRPL